MKKRFLNLLKKKSVLAIGIPAIILLLIIIGFSTSNNKPSFEIAAAEIKDVVEEVDVTGRVAAAENVNLAFEKGGTVGTVYVKVGDRVKSGQTLGSLESGTSYAQYKQAEANYNVELLKLNELKRGTRAEELAIAQAKYASADVAAKDARRELLNTLHDAYIKVDDAIRNKTDFMFNNPQSASVSLKLANPDTERRTVADRYAVELSLLSTKALLDTLAETSDLDAATVKVQATIAAAVNFLNSLSLTVNSTIINHSLSQTTADAYRSAVSSAGTLVNTASANVTSSSAKLRSALSGLALEANELNLSKAGASDIKIDQQQSLVDVAAANLESARVELAKTQIKSPIDGIVTRVVLKKGEIFTAGVTAFAVISDHELQIEVNVPEADIAKIKVGDVATITLDAYGSDIAFGAKVVAIDPAETIIEGVPTYKVTLQFDTKDERIRSGMTANITITTNTKNNVITVPFRAILDKDGGKYIRVVTGDSYKEVKVETGLRGSDGSVEIRDGILEGQEVVTFIKK